MIESLANVFDDSEDAMEEIVDEGNAFFTRSQKSKTKQLKN